MSAPHRYRTKVFFLRFTADELAQLRAADYRQKSWMPLGEWARETLLAAAVRLATKPSADEAVASHARAARARRRVASHPPAASSSSSSRRCYAASGTSTTLHVLRTRTQPTDRASRGMTVCGRDATGSSWSSYHASAAAPPTRWTICADCKRMLGTTADVDTRRRAS